MASYSLEIKRSAVREIEAVPTKKARRLLVNRVSRLADDPHPPEAEKLAADDRYRVRQGPYRIVYRVDDDARTVCVVKIGHRRDVYRR